MLGFLKSIYRKLRVYQKKRSLRGKVIFERDTFVSYDSVFEGGNRVARGTRVVGSSIGYGSYIGPSSTVENTVVGKYCSLASKLDIVRGRHPIDQVSTHPAFYSLAKQAGFTYVDEQSFDEYKYADAEKKISVIIGNDVWVTKNVTIVEGVTIGDGAIVLNGAVVTKDVEPYTIVGGVPAKLVRYRFEPEMVEWLMELRWWDKGEEWIRSHVKYFSDPKKLKEIVESENRNQGE